MKFSEINYVRPNLAHITTQVQEKVVAMEAADLFDTQVSLILDIENFAKEIANAQMLATIRHHQNTNDSFYKEEIAYFNQNLPKTGNAFKCFSEQIIASPFQEQISQRFGHHFLNTTHQLRKLNNPAAETEQVAVSQLVNDYMQLMAQLSCTWEGKEMPLNALRIPSQSTDRELRKKAFNAKIAATEKAYPQAASIFQQLVDLRFQMAEKLGFSNPIEMSYLRMKRLDYNAQDVAKLRTHLRNRLLPIQQKLQQEKQERLGLKELKYFDRAINFADGNPQLQVKGEALMETAETMYAALSPEVHAYFKQMRELEMFDFEPRVGKSPGGFCAPLPLEFSSFIFGSFAGTSYDFALLTHELGHAFQFYMSAPTAKEIMDYRYATLETAEIHSTAMEFFTWNWYHLFFGADTKKYQYQKLFRIPGMLMDICLMDHFQEEIYTHPAHTPADRCQLYRSLEQTYFPYMTDDFYDQQATYLLGKAWIHVSHIFHRPFYMIDYAIAQICAMQFWKRSQTDFEGAWADYIKLCKIGGSVPFAEAIKIVNLKSPFEKETIDEVIDYMEEVMGRLIG